MAMPTMTFRTLLDQEAETYFWIRSDTIFRPSEFFSEIIYYYLLKLEESHQMFKVHQWEGKTLPENLMFIGYNHKKICFVQDPVTATATDFENQRAQDYKDLANLIQLAQGWYMLPRISEKNCPELLNFMELLKNSWGKELSLKKHYSLWGCSRRFKFFLDFQTRYVQDQFKRYFDDSVKLWKGIDFGKEYSEGFVAKLMDEPLLRKVYFYEHSTPYENTLADLVRFSRNLTAHYSKDKSGNPQTMSLVEWKLFVRFPFLMIAICEVLASMNMFDQFAD